MSLAKQNTCQAIKFSCYQITVTILLAFCLPVAFCLPAFANSQDSKIQDLSDRIMSPYCPGRTLSACPSDQARKLRVEIGTWYEQGYSDEAVENRLTMLFGKEVFGVPSDSKVGRFGWYMPTVFVLLMLGAIVIVLRKMRTIEEPPVDEATMAEVQAELSANIDKSNP